MHVGHDMSTRYQLRDGHKHNELHVIEEEKNLGVYNSANLKSSLQC